MRDDANPDRRLAPLAWAFAANYLYRLLGAALLALPVVTLLTGSGIRSFAAGDALLFEPGGLFLLEVLVRAFEPLVAALTPLLLALLALGCVALLPEWWLIGALGPSPPQRHGLRRFIGLALIMTGARLLLGLLTLGLALTARSFVASARDERWPLAAVALVGGGGLLLQLVVSVWHDLAKVDVVARGAPLRDATLDALALAQVSGAGLIARYAAARLLSLGALLGAVVLVATLDVARDQAWRSAGAIAVQQLAVLASLALRTAWLWVAHRAWQAWYLR